MSYDSDTNFIYILSANECQQRNDDEMMLTAVSAAADRPTPTFVYKHTSHVIRAAGSELFDQPPKMRVLSRDQIV